MTTLPVEGGRRRIPRLAIAKWAIETLPDKVKAEGKFQAAVPRLPAHWRLATRGCRLVLSEGMVRLPDDPALSTLLDVWLDVGGKVLSVDWFPKKPWLPPRITTLKQGDWLYLLGWEP